MIEGEVPVPFPPHCPGPNDVPDGLGKPALNLVRPAVGDGLLRVVLGLENRHPADQGALHVQPGALRGPLVAGELRAHFPLTGPTRTEARCGLLVDAVDAACELSDHVAAASVEDRVAGDRVHDVQRLSEAVLDRGPAVGELHWRQSVTAERVGLEVELQRSHHAFERLGGLWRMFEVAIGLGQGFHADGFGLLAVGPAFEERLAGNLHALGKGPAGNQMHALGFRLPVFDVCAKHLLRARPESREHSAVPGVREHGAGDGHLPAPRCAIDKKAPASRVTTLRLSLP